MFLKAKWEMLNYRINKHNPLLKNLTFEHLLQWWCKLSKDWLEHTKMGKGVKPSCLCLVQHFTTKIT